MEKHRAKTCTEDAIKLVRQHEGLLIVDLDQTLYLQNSTEDYIGTARPAALASFALKVLGALRPWRLTGGETTRDLWRVVLLNFLLPWTPWLWRRRLKREGVKLRNELLTEALKARATGRVVVATLGFGRIVRPLLTAMGFGKVEVIACRMSTREDRTRGKLAMVCEALGERALAEALVISDSAEDEPLFGRCATPVYTQWPEAISRPAFHDCYVPLRYLSRIKRGKCGAVKTIVIEDFAHWLLATLPAVLLSPARICGLGCLFLSFWAIYEYGYIENDMVALERESDPHLSQQARLFHFSSVRLWPWLYAALFGVLGVALLRHSGPRQFGLGLIAWGCVLAATRSVFRVYNLCDKDTRVWIYPVLQLLRTFAFVVVAPINLAGAGACLAMALARSESYRTYRYVRSFGISEYPEMPLRMMRLWIFILGLGIVRLVGSMDRQFWIIAGVIVLYNMFLARRDAQTAMESVSFLTKLESGAAARGPMCTDL
jgi:phosphoserine phosphatase